MSQIVLIDDAFLEWLVVFLATIPMLAVISKRFSHGSKRSKMIHKKVDDSAEVPDESSYDNSAEVPWNEAMHEKVSKMNVLDLPQEVQGAIFSYAGMSAMSHIAGTCQACCYSIWNNPITWNSIVLSLGLAPEQGAPVQSMQSTVRRTLYGIDHLCRHPLSGTCKINVRGDHCSLLQQATRACIGLSFEDGAETADQVIGRCLELLVSFNVDEAEARRHAKELASTVDARTDVFSPEQCHKVESAFSDAMDLHQLLSDVMLAPAESEMALDDAFTPPFDADIWGDEGVPCRSVSASQVLSDSGCCPDVDAALDRLISMLRDIVDDEVAAVTTQEAVPV